MTFISTEKQKQADLLSGQQGYTNNASQNNYKKIEKRKITSSNKYNKMFQIITDFFPSETKTET